MSEIVAYRYRYKDALTWVHSTAEPARHPNLIVEPLCLAGKGWIANCFHCGRVIDTRETKDGGDEFGAQLTDGRWACSFDCVEATDA